MMARRSLQDLRRHQGGASLVEFALLAPVLIFLLLGAVTLFDLFRNAQSVEKATFTVGDMMSRQTAMSQANLDAMLSLVRHMVPSASDGGLRVSSISKSGGRFVVNWTRTSGSAIPTTPVATTTVPNIAEGDSVLLTESFVPHRAFFAAFGIDAITFGAQAANRPRFVSSIAFQ